jgi:hypothetical protein
MIGLLYPWQEQVLLPIQLHKMLPAVQFKNHFLLLVALTLVQCVASWWDHELQWIKSIWELTQWIKSIWELTPAPTR